MNKQEYNGSALVSEVKVKPIQSNHKSNSKRLFIIVDRQEFVRGCLNSWITMFCPEFELASGADVITALSTEMLAQASVVIFSANGAVQADGWLDNQVAWLKANCPNLPIVAIVRPGRSALDRGPGTSFSFAGLMCRPTAAWRLQPLCFAWLLRVEPIFRRFKETNPPPLAVGTGSRASEGARAARLTPRECMVLEASGARHGEQDHCISPKPVAKHGKGACSQYNLQA